MADPLGTTLGVLGVVGVLSVCLQGFDLIQAGCSVGKDFTLLQKEYSSQQFRVHVWARMSGFFDKGGPDRRLDDVRVKAMVQIQLEAIALLLEDASKIVRRYQIAQGTNLITTLGATTNFVEKGLYLDRIKQTKKQAGVLGAFRWALKDRAAFETLLPRLKNRIDSLYFVTEKLHLFEQEKRSTHSRLRSRASMKSLFCTRPFRCRSQNRLGQKDGDSKTTTTFLQQHEEILGPEHLRGDIG
ncbi:prion-inhibition and propagation-domain-containing protein [Apiospora kogelbergensis]|uniref:prion-inhibition and propagation-domain-containing protein n=1 Tax=Apiospora kogelbergensis TaxID=1337665 RepID=UPI00312FFFFB